jgi:hypothetical protein
MRRRSFALTLAVVFALIGWSSGPAAFRGGDLPERLSDQEFWRLTEELSEPTGYFRSDNLLSNEQVFARVIPELVAVARPGGVYLGVGPEQNFTYIAAIKPKIAFIIDIRRGNLLLQLMYKALFETSPDRADFLARLFTRKRPEGLTTSSTASDLFQAYWDAPAGGEEIYQENLHALLEVLTRKHSLPLSSDDVSGIDAIYKAFYIAGPAITWSTNVGGGLSRGGRGVSYAALMTQTDQQGEGLSYLATEDKFRLMKDLEARNLVVPVVGDFGGPKAIRAVGSYLKQRTATVTAFYLSNVEQYLRQDGKTTVFCRNVAMLPLDESSVFIRPSGAGIAVYRPIPYIVVPQPVPPGSTTPRPYTVPAIPGPRSTLYPMVEEVKNCGAPAPVSSSQ